MSAIKTSGVKVYADQPTYSQSIEHRWGSELGDTTTYTVRVKGKSCTVARGGKDGIDAAVDVWAEIAQGVLDCIAAQTKATQ